MKNLIHNGAKEFAIEIIEQEKPYIQHLECDGATRVLTHALTNAGILHKVFYGKLKYKGDVVIPVHYWIELITGERVDFKAQMWLPGVRGVPNGVFNLLDFPLFEYNGNEITMNVSELIYKILRTKK